MRSNVVVSALEAVENALLKGGVGGGWFCSAGFESSVHAFMGSVLLRVSGSDALVSDAELKPPDVQACEAVNAGRGKGSPVVTADGVWKSMSTKQVKELVLNGFSSYVGERPATEEIAAEVIDDGERVAVMSIAHAKVAFEINGPNLVGCGGVEGSGTGMLPTSATGTRANASVSLEDIEDGASCWPVPVGKTPAEPLENLSGTPSVARVLCQDELDELRRGLMRARPGCSAVLSEPTRTVLPIPVNPL